MLLLCYFSAGIGRYTRTWRFDPQLLSRSAEVETALEWNTEISSVNNQVFIVYLAFVKMIKVNNYLSIII